MAKAAATVTTAPSFSGPPATTLASDSQTAVSVFECEQLLLAPDEGRWPLESLGLFGLELEGVQV